MAHALAALHVQRAGVDALALNVGGSVACQCLGLHGNKVHQIMHMQHIAGREHAGHVGLQVLVHHSAVGVGVNGDAGILQQLVLRDQAHGEDQRITLVLLLGAGDGPTVRVHLGDGHAGQTVTAMDLGDGVAEIERDIVVIQTLHDVARQAGGVRHQLEHCLHMSAFQRHAACHDHADIAGAEDDDLLAGHPVVEVHVSLRGACGEHARRTLAGNAQCAAAALLAAHGKHHSLCLILAQAAAGGGGDDTILRQAQHRGAGLVRDLTLVHFINERLCIFRAGQALAEAAQTETVMDALAQDAAQHRLALQNDHVADALLVQLHRCGKTCRAAADNHNVFLFHRSVLLLPHIAGEYP